PFSALRRPKKKKKKHHKKKHHKKPVAAAPPPATAAPPTPPAPPVTGGPAVDTTAPRDLPAADRHLLRRFSAGITPALAQAVTDAGSARAWFAAQLDPAGVADPDGDSVAAWFPTLQRDAATIFQRQVDDVQGSWEVMEDLSRWTVTRRIHSTRQVQELMVDFWSNLLHVPLNGDPAVFWRVDYDQMIRRYALTTFEDLLRNAITHPAMGLNLSNAVSTKDAPNENLGRELLELHTVGVGTYTEADVKASARMLTGYRVDVWWPSFRSFYDTTWHDATPVTVMGFTDPNGSADGRASTTKYLKYLAHHPATAQRIARRLAVKFVRDDPSDSLVNAVAGAYLDSGTAIKTTLLALVDHPDFAAAAGLKVRMPLEDYVAMVRGLGITLQQPTREESFAKAMHWQYSDAGQAPYDWPAPNGFPEVNAAWSSAGRVLTSFALHRVMAAHWWPNEGAVLPELTSYFPPLPATLQTVIDTVGLRVLGQAPGPQISQGIATLVGMSLSANVTASKASQDWFVIGMVASLLDSPLHLHR
ncbi:MAG: hypothetical protein JWO46_2761, partial [Nocardioidaceae bacterium]|nr:hypothetical protein [Nocardioidaceae bacterium]